MTLLEFVSLLRRWRKLVAALPLVCAATCVLVLLVTPSEYQAKAVLSASSEISAIGGIAEVAANEVDTESTEVSVSTDTSKKQLVITASGHAAGLCVMVANEAASLTKANARDIYDKVNIEIIRATSAENASPPIGKYSLAALLAGLFAACCFVVIWDIWKKPIKSTSDLASATKAPVLGVVSIAGESDGLAFAKLTANIGFTVPKEEGSKTVCFIPVDDSSSVKALYAALEPEVTKQGLHTLTIELAPSLSESETASYIARAADATILVANKWIASHDAVEAAVRDLALARANLAGAILLDNEAHAKKKHREEAGLISWRQVK